MWEIVTTSLPQLIMAGIKYTIPLSLISFALGLMLALITALVRISKRVKNSKLSKGSLIFTFGYFVQHHY